MRALLLLLLTAAVPVTAQTLSTTFEWDLYPYPDDSQTLGLLEVLAPESEAGVFQAGTCFSGAYCSLPGDAGYGPLPLVFSTDVGNPNNENPAPPGRGCGPQTNPLVTQGTVVLFVRPDNYNPDYNACSQNESFFSASFGGGLGLVMYQDERVDASDDETLFNMSWIYAVLFDMPGLTLTRYRGERLRAALDRGEEVIVRLHRADAFALAAETETNAPALALRVAPNPARERAAVYYTLPEAGAARLAVYDVLGREVAVLVDEARSAGEHPAVLDARALPPGPYVARLTTKARAEAVRFTVTR